MAAHPSPPVSARPSEPLAHRALLTHCATQNAAASPWPGASCPLTGRPCCPRPDNALALAGGPPHRGTLLAVARIRGVTAVAGVVSDVVAANRAVTISGTVTQPQPGFPNVAGAAVTIDQVAGGTVVPVASGNTDGSGNYSITFTPPSSGSYQAATGEISQVEIASLSPADASSGRPETPPAVTTTR